MREEKRTVIVDTVPESQVVFPDTPYAMWARGELHDFLHLSDNTQVEIIGGKVVLSPSPSLGHGRIQRMLHEPFTNARAANPDFPWMFTIVADLNLVEIEEGYVPDMMVFHADVLRALEDDDDRHALPDHVEMVVEVTSPSNAGNDREPTRRRPATKWAGYARVEVPYYLLIDRDPKAPLITLFSVPDQGSRAYLHKDTWRFGDTISLEHFGLEIDTTGWKPWKA